jgi:hypothetical protein
MAKKHLCLKKGCPNLVSGKRHLLLGRVRGRSLQGEAGQHQVSPANGAAGRHPQDLRTPGSRSEVSAALGPAQPGRGSPWAAQKGSEKTGRLSKHPQRVTGSTTTSTFPNRIGPWDS